jgi:hypothetical protein
MLMGAPRLGHERDPMTRVESVIRQMLTSLDAIGASYALVGGLAVSARAELDRTLQGKRP